MYYPGEEIGYTEEALLGHGTYKDADREGKEIAVAALFGEIHQTDRLITIQHKSQWYVPCVGDVVVGKVTRIANKRWYVEINSKTEAVLMLTAINLEGNVQRRKGELDEIMMQKYFALGDILVAEVQSVGQKPQIHTRSEKYSKIPFGVLLEMHPRSVGRGKTQFYTLPGNQKEIRVVLGVNGYVTVHGEPEEVLKIREVAQELMEMNKNHVQLDEASLQHLIKK